MLNDAIRTLSSRLPKGWRVAPLKTRPATGRQADCVLQVRAPDGSTGHLLVECKSQFDPRDVSRLPERVTSLKGSRSSARRILVTRFLSPRTREELEKAGVGYIDLTGNTWISLSRPGLFLSQRAADRNPWREKRPTRSLKGSKAGRVVRALCDFTPPLGIRDLSKRAGTDPGYVSRIVTFLDREAIVTRTPRGPVTAVDWQGLIRRWAEDYSPYERTRVESYLEPRGLSSALDKLRDLSFRYAITGSMAASKVAPVAAPRLLVCYVDDRAQVAKALDLRPAESGANVLFVSPFDSVVYDRTVKRDGVTCAALSQVAADLLTSPGHRPAESDALMKWMAANEHVWRS